MLSILAVVSLILAATPRPASACSCMVPDLADSVEEAAAVFIGTQTSHVGTGFDTMLTLDVHTVFKGDLGPTVDLRTADSSAACGITFSTDARSGVVAYANGEGLTVNLCSSGWSADELEAFFGEGAAPPPDTTIGTTAPTIPPTTPPSTIAPAPDAPPSTVDVPTTVRPPIADGPTATTTATSVLGDGQRPSSAVAIARGAAVLAIAGPVIGVATAMGRPGGREA